MVSTIDMQYLNELTPIPREVYEYYAEHQEEFDGIPLNAELCRAITKRLYVGGGKCG